MKIKYTLLILIVSVFTLGCKKKPCIGCEQQLPLVVFNFDIGYTDAKGVWVSKITNKNQVVEVWYEENGRKNYMGAGIVAKADNTSFYIRSAKMPGKSVEGIKTFYMQLDHGTTNTIYLDVVDLGSKAPGDGERYPFREVKFDGVKANMVYVAAVGGVWLLPEN